MSSTTAATAIRISSTGRSTAMPPSGELSSGNAAARWSMYRPWLAQVARICSIVESSSARACSRVDPGASRPIRLIQRLPRTVSRSPPGMTSGCVPTGTHMSYDKPETAPRKPGAATPITVKGCELILSWRPITAGIAD